MKYVKFLFRNKEMNTTLEYDQAYRVMTSQNQLVMLMDKEGKWTGESINKADLIGTVRDWTRERQEGYTEDQIEGPKPRRAAWEEIQQFKPKFLERKEGTTKGAKSIKDIL